MAGPNPNVARWESLIRQAAAENAPLQASLFAALVQQESGGDPRIVSGAGAGGLTQLMPATAKSLGVTSVFDPLQNLLGGAKYLLEQFKRFGTWELALAAYNAGPGAVAQFGGIPPYAETQGYVRNILAIQPDYAAWDAPVQGPVVAAMPVLRQGYTGTAVAVLQKLLGGSLAIDGQYGPQTLAAVLAAKKAAALPDDEIVGEGLWRALSGVKSSG